VPTAVPVEARQQRTNVVNHWAEKLFYWELTAHSFAEEAHWDSGARARIGFWQQIGARFV